MITKQADWQCTDVSWDTGQGSEKSQESTQLAQLIEKKGSQSIIKVNIIYSKNNSNWK